MATEIYSLERCIEQFFNILTTTTKAKCDIKTASLVAAPVVPVPVYGQWSYMVTARPNKAITMQFRAESSTLDMKIVNIAILVHPRYVPKYSYHKQISGKSPLSIYVMEKHKGVCYIETRDISLERKSAFEAR